MIGQAVIPSDWEGGYCCYSVEWPDSPQWLAVLRGVLILPSRGRFWDEHTGTITEAQEVIKATYDNNLHLQGVLMACNDPGLALIAQALNNLAAAQCCGSSIGSNGGLQIVITTPLGQPAPIYGSVPPTGLEEGTKPPDYPGTQEEYETDKCRTANSIIIGSIETMRNWSYINFAQSTGLILILIAAVGGAIVMPPAIIPILIGAAAIVVGLGAALRAMADEIEANKAEWVCWLYEGQNTSVVIGLIADAIDAIIASISVSSPLGVALKTIALIIFNSDTVNQLFTMSQGQGEAYDCSECGPNPCCVLFVEDTEGFTATAAVPVWGTNTNDCTLTWIEESRVTLLSTKPGGGGYAAMISTDYECLVTPEHTNFYVNFEATGNAFSMYLFLRTGSEWVQRFADNMGSSTTSANEDITDLEGDTINGVAIMVSRAGTAPMTVTFNSLGVECS